MVSPTVQYRFVLVGALFALELRRLHSSPLPHTHTPSQSMAVSVVDIITKWRNEAFVAGADCRITCVSANNDTHSICTPMLQGIILTYSNYHANKSLKQITQQLSQRLSSEPTAPTSKTAQPAPPPHYPRLPSSTPLSPPPPACPPPPESASACAVCLGQPAKRTPV